MSPRRYFDRWEDHGGMVAGWSQGEWDWEAKQYKYAPIEGMATDEEVLFACYTDENYSGDASVVFERDGALYEATGSHCSCYGLEGQWKPERVTWASLAMRDYFGDWPAEAVEAWKAMVGVGMWCAIGQAAQPQAVA